MILDAIVAAKRRGRAQAGPVNRSALAGAKAARPFAAALRGAKRPAVIAEFKRRSPSAGAIRPDGDVAAVAREYGEAGAAALSVLTDGEFFGGSLADLEAARAAVGLPVLRKDFALFEEDLVVARAAGADAALLIVRLLDDALLARLLATAAEIGLEALVEVHGDEECRRAVGAGAVAIGVNHRDLDTLAIDLGLSERLLPLIPPSVVRVAESGLRTAKDVARVRDLGYDAVLIGEALMRAPSPGVALRGLMGEGA